MAPSTLIFVTPSSCPMQTAQSSASVFSNPSGYPSFFRAKCFQRAVFHSCSFDQYPPPLPPSTLSRESQTSATRTPYDGSLFQMQTPSLAFEALRRCDSLREMRVNPFPATDPKKAAV